MKTLNLLISILFLLAFNSFAQSYVPFPTSNAIWCGQRGYLTSSGSGFIFNDYNYQQFINGDTVINSLVYHKLFETGNYTWQEVPMGPGTQSGSGTFANEYQGCFREDATKKLYYIPALAPAEVLFYDFNLSVGDTLPISYLHFQQTQLVVTSIDSVLTNTIYRKKYNISTADTTLWSDPNNFEYVSLIEGIGSTHGLNWEITPYFESNGTLYAHSLNGTVVYPDNTVACIVVGLNNAEVKNGITIFPNPSNDMIMIKSSDVINSITIYDVLGKIIFTKNKISNTSAETIDAAAFSNGVYFAKVKTSSAVYQEKIILSK